jgi:hypothetical protein
MTHEMNATGCHFPSGWCYERTPPRANPEASTSMQKTPVGSGCAMTGSDATSSFMSSKAFCSAGPHSNGVFPKSQVNGLVTLEYPLIYRR